MSTPEPESGTAVDAGLRKGALGLPGLLAQSVANMAPAAAMALLPLLVFANARNGTWLSWLFALISMLLAAYCIVQFARRFARAGAFYVYVAKSFGPLGGMLAGWGLYLGYVATGMATVVGFGIYGGAFLSQVGLPGEHPIVQAILYFAGILLPAYLAFRDIRLSAETELALQIISAGIIAFLVVVLWVEKGMIDTKQLTLSGTSWNGVGLGIVLAIFSFVGFESSATLGLEAKDPFKAIGRAVIWSCALVGCFYVIVSYTQILGFEGAKTPFEKSTAPLFDLTGIAGLPWLGYAVNLGISFMVAVFVNNLYPVPPFPLNILPYIFVAYVVVGLVWYFVRIQRSPGLYGRLGSLFETAEDTKVGVT